MTIKKIVLQNFGIFGGRHVFDICPRSDLRPIILFGGKNGSGKTTILEAIRLALHGRRAVGGRVTRSEYGSFLDERTHRTSESSNAPRRALVEVEISHVQQGQPTDYSIVRSWIRNGIKTEDSLIVYQDGDILNSYERDQWEEFVEGLLPANLTDLYFFDAERIEALTRQSTSHETLAASVKSVLGLDLVDRLIDDLSLYLSRTTDGISEDRFAHELSQILGEIEQSKRLLSRLREQRASEEAEAGRLAARLQRSKDALTSAGGSFASKAQIQSVRAAELDQQIEKMERTGRDMCGGPLPFGTVGSLLDCLERRVLSEIDGTSARVLDTMAKKVASTVLSRLRDSSLWEDAKVPPEYVGMALSKIEGVVEGTAQEFESARATSVIHGFGTRDAARILEWCRRLRESEQQKFIDICEQIDVLYTERSRCAAIVRATPSEEALAPFVERLEDDVRRLAEADSRLRRLDDDLEAATTRLERLIRDRRRVTDKIGLANTANRKVSLAARTMGALGVYNEQLTRRKFQQLENAIGDRFGALSRKGDLITKVSVDPANYRLRLNTGGGRHLSTAQLSAGEKQLFAIAILWAMRDVSRRPLPLVMDTPMGRLDSEHRGRLIKSYFPHVSHQLLVLSTDTEIDRSYYSKLQPCISKAYHLGYDSARGSTKVSEGYFWSVETGTGV